MAPVVQNPLALPGTPLAWFAIAWLGLLGSCTAYLLFFWLINAWGPTRVSLLHAEHAHQRAVLAVLTGRSAWPASTLVAGRTLSMCDDLIIDMEFEERELLNERVLRDDLIVLDASDA